MKALKFLSALMLVMAMALNISAKDYIDNPGQKIPMNPQVTQGELPNGMKYFIRENAKPENRAELQIVIKAGSVHEDDDQKGLAHFIEHMCFNGTENFPKNDLIKFLESTGMRFGGDVNANTGFDRTYYMLTIPLDKEGLLEDGFQVLEDWLQNVTFDQEELDKERGVIIEEWRSSLNANRKAIEKHLEVITKGSKFWKRFPIGDTAIIKNAPREVFVRYYEDWYRPNLSAIIAVGDFDKNEIEKMIKERFGKLKNPANERKMEEFTIPANQQADVSIYTDKELTFPAVSVYIKHAQNKKILGTYKEYRMNVTNSFISQMLNTRMGELTQKADAPYLQAFGGYSNFFGGLDVFNLGVVAKADNIQGGYKAALQEVFRAEQHGFTESELERAKTAYLTGMEAAYNERDKTESMPIAQELFRHFYQQESVPGIEKEWEMAQAFAEDITLDEVNKMYNGFLASNSLVITANIPEREGVEKPTEDELMAIYKEVKSSKLDAYEDAATDQPLISEMPQAGKIAGEKSHDKLDMKELTLSNGATVYLKKTDFKNDQVLMRAYSKGGLSLAPDNMYYSASAADGIVQQGGLGEFDLITLNKMMTGKRANVSPFIGDRTEGFQGSASPEDLEILFQQLHLYFTSPRIDEEASKAYKDRIKESIKNSQSNPGSVFNDTISAVMANHHMREMPWTEADLEKIELEKAFEFYKERFSNAGDFTFFFVGNFDEAKIKGYLEQYVASLPGSDDKEMWKDNGVRDNEKSFTKEVKKGIEPKSQVRIVMNGDFDFNRQNRFDMSSMIEVLRVRLREEIREKMGGVYGIGAYPSMDFYPDGSYKIQILFTTSPTLVDTLVVEVKKVIEEMKEGGFDEKYITDAKELMKREHETNLKENSYWLNTLYTYDYYGEPKEQVLEYMDNVNKVTKDKVVKAANKYLDMDSWKLFVLNPEDS